MREAAGILNKGGIVIEKERIDKAFRKYHGLYMKSCYKLYDLGYSSPSLFDRSTFIKCLREQFPNESSVLFNYTDGSIMLTYHAADFARIKYKNNESFVNVMNILYTLLHAEDALKSLELFASKVNMKRKLELTVFPRLSVSKTVENDTVLPLDNFAVQECFKRNEDTKLIYFDTRDCLIHELCKKIEISDKDYDIHKLTGQAFFLDGFTASEELKFTDLIMSSSVELSGKYGKALQDYIIKYYSDSIVNSKSRTSCLKFETVVFVDSLQERLDKIAVKRRSLKSLGGRDFYVTKDYNIFEIPLILSEGRESYFKDGLIVSNYALDYETNEEFDKVNNLLGFGGEFISKADVEHYGYQTRGLPITLNRYTKAANGELKVVGGQYYPIYNVSILTRPAETEKEFDSTLLLPKVGTTFEFTFSDISTACKKLNVEPTKEALFKQIKSDVLENYGLTFGFAMPNVSKKSYASLVSDLTCALIYMDCGYPDYKLCFDSYEFVTDDIYLKAAYDAVMQFKQNC